MIAIAVENRLTFEVGVQNSLPGLQYLKNSSIFNSLPSLRYLSRFYMRLHTVSIPPSTML